MLTHELEEMKNAVINRVIRDLGRADYVQILDQVTFDDMADTVNKVISAIFDNAKAGDDLADLANYAENAAVNIVDAFEISRYFDDRVLDAAKAELEKSIRKAIGIECSDDNAEY